jgi:hypothetical protein
MFASGQLEESSPLPQDRPMRKTLRSLALVAALTGVSAPAVAQIPASPRALGMGGAYIGIARGHEALFLNPANLALDGNPGWSLALPSPALGGTTWGPGVEDFFRLAAGEVDQSTADEVVAMVPGTGMRMDLEVRVPLLALQIGPVALGASYGAVVEQTFGKDIVDLLLNGFEEGRTDYGVGNTGGSRATYVDYAAAYGRRVGPVSIGVTGHYLQGRRLSRSRLFDPRIDAKGESIEVDYAEVLSAGGNGFVLDVGAAMQPVRNLTLSAAVSNLAGTMRWNQELRVRDVTLTEEDFEADLLDISDRFGGSERPFVRGKSARSDALAESLTEGAGLPRVLRLGAAYNLPSYTRIAAAYQGNLASGRLAGGWDRSLGVGVQQRLLILTARAGYANSLNGRTMLSGGLSLGPLDIGAARLSGTTDNHKDSGWMITVGSSFRGGIRRAAAPAASAAP